MFKYNTFPSPHCVDGVKLYLEEGVPMGGFMMAVISNDLKEACARADHINQYNLFDIVGWFYNEAPHDCWGTPEKVNAWMAKKVKEREQAKNEKS